MRIQMALDYPPSIEAAISVAKQIREYIDIIELGETMISRYSLGIVSLFKSIFPEKKVLADLKIMDDGYICANFAFDAGADIVTACVLASENTARGLVRAAKERGRESWLDFIAVPAEDYVKYVDYVNNIGPDYVCAHMAADISRIGTEGHANTKKTMIDHVSKLSFKPKVVLSGGLTVEDIPIIKTSNAHHINVGSAFFKTNDPVLIARTFAEA